MRGEGVELTDGYIGKANLALEMWSKKGGKKASEKNEYKENVNRKTDDKKGKSSGVFRGGGVWHTCWQERHALII